MELKKVILYIVLPATIIFGPFIALSSPSMGCYQAQIDKNPNSQSAKDWQLTLADICLKTMRPEMAAEMYGKYVDRHPQDPKRAEALWLKAYAHEKAEDKHSTIKTLVKLFNEHGDTEWARKADEKLNKQYQYFSRDAE